MLAATTQHWRELAVDIVGQERTHAGRTETPPVAEEITPIGRGDGTGRHSGRAVPPASSPPYSRRALERVARRCAHGAHSKQPRARCWYRDRRRRSRSAALRWGPTTLAALR